MAGNIILLNYFFYVYELYNKTDKYTFTQFTLLQIEFVLILLFQLICIGYLVTILLRKNLYLNVGSSGTGTCTFVYKL